ncbi:MAG TPA: 50S ribosomal protein L13 [archaeon]|nr:50S ribosomal protein L13 [archaeon]
MKMTTVIDATDTIMGRLASGIAKRLLMGEHIVVVNAERAVIVGRKEEILKSYKQTYDRGHRYMGPFYPRMPHLIFKRTVRGMLPRQTAKGKGALQHLLVHLGVPEQLKDAKLEVPEEFRADVIKQKVVRLEDISKFLGWVPVK